MKLVESLCTYCGVGCDILATVKENRVLKIESNSGVTSSGNLCIKGREGFGFLEHRLDRVKIKKSFIEKNRELFNRDILDSLEDIDSTHYSSSYEIAYKIVAIKTDDIKNRYSSDAICGVGGARTSCESAYSFQKFIREVLNSPHIDCCARVCHSPSLKGLKETIGEGASTNPFDDILESEFLIIIGSNTTEAHPIASNRVTKALNSGVNLALFDIRDITLSKLAKYNCTIPYESNLLILNMIAYVILKESLYDREFIKNRVCGFQSYRDSILSDEFANPDFFKKVRGYEYLAKLIPEVAREYASSRSMILWGLGVTEHIDGTHSVMAIANLALLSGNIGKRGAGLMPLRGQNNVQGACDMGCLPYFKPDYKAPDRVGMMTPDMIDSMLDGEIKILFNMGEDIAHIHPNLNRVERALNSLEMVVVNEVSDSEITKFADILFPVKSAYEKEGVYINAERRLHLSSALVESSYPDDWEVYREISKLLNSDKLNFNSSKEVWSEVQKVAPDRFSGAFYEKLKERKKSGIQWPVKEEGVEVLHSEDFRTDDGLGHLKYSRWQKRGMIKRLLKQKRFDKLYLSTGRVLSHYNNSAQTKYSKKLIDRDREDILLISIEDSYLVTGDRVILESKYGKSAPLRVKFTKKQKRGTLFCTFHHSRSRINYLFGDEADEFVKTPRFKSLRVKIVNID